jgi:hypothetical protein
MRLAGRDEKNRSGADGVKLPADTLLPPAAQVDKQLPMGVPVRTLAIEWMEVPVDA